MTETDESISYTNCTFTGKDGESEWYDFKESQKGCPLIKDTKSIVNGYNITIEEAFRLFYTNIMASIVIIVINKHKN
ncbi:hypothetical protein A3Q56_01630 [Intoshia linei]|uniref:Uncharacterized protein n=1 Tax=Intoshia linei TaxID=1819745 RepID=A0A177BAB4_9BILA|nr:hypothetical protein A3Q56_01630 [Intoshia linei]